MDAKKLEMKTFERYTIVVIEIFVQKYDKKTFVNISHVYFTLKIVLQCGRVCLNAASNCLSPFNYIINDY